MLERKSIAVGRSVLSYLSAGKGDAVVFLHGWRSEAAVWKPAMEALAEAGYAVYAPDLPGFGNSELPPHAFSVGDYTNAVSSFVRKLDIGEAVIVGHSFGGRIGIMLAATSPELVSKLVLVDAAGIRKASVHRKLAKLGAKIVKPLFSYGFAQPLRRKIYAMLGADDYLATPALQETFTRVINEDLSSFLPKINQETLIFWGGKDTDTPPSYATTMKKTIPHATLEIVPEAGHFSFLDAPERFLASLKEFIA